MKYRTLSLGLILSLAAFSLMGCGGPFADVEKEKVPTRQACKTKVQERARLLAGAYLEFEKDKEPYFLGFSLPDNSLVLFSCRRMEDGEYLYMKSEQDKNGTAGIGKQPIDAFTVVEQIRFSSMAECRTKARGDAKTTLGNRLIAEEKTPFELLGTSDDGKQVKLMCLGQESDAYFIKAVQVERAQGDNRPFPVGTKYPFGFSVVESDYSPSMSKCKEKAKAQATAATELTPIADDGQSWTFSAALGGKEVNFSCSDRSGSVIFLRTERPLPL